MSDFPTDLFISYAHIDNQPLPTVEEGWIARFDKSLRPFVATRLGANVEVWRDPKLAGNDVFANEIIFKFKETAVLVAVITPRYLNSEWCRREAEEFCREAEKNGGVVIGNKARIFKVYKFPVDSEEQLPDVMGKLLGYDFYTTDEGSPVEIDPGLGEDYAKAYHLRLSKLAWEISQMLKSLEGEAAGVTETVISDEGGPTVYLAECAYDRREARENLEGELRRHGYHVLPDQVLPQAEDEYVEAVEKLIERADLSIHLVGSIYGAVPDGPSDKSTVVLQNEIAARASRDRDLPRIIWLPEGTQTEHRRQGLFIKGLQTENAMQEGADLITADLEDLKTVVHDTLNRLSAGPEADDVAAEQSERAKMVYLICDERDRKATIPIRKFMRKQGLDVQIPAFDGDAGDVRQSHRDLLATCDAVALFYGEGDEAWKRTQVSDIRKMQGYRDGKSIAAKYTILSPPLTADKEDLIATEEPNLIDCLEEYSDQALMSFVAALKS